jgi:hypothetical protein
VTRSYKDATNTEMARVSLTSGGVDPVLVSLVECCISGRILLAMVHCKTLAAMASYMEL